MVSRARRDAEIRGRRAEWVAQTWLRLKGYSILATRFKRSVGEIDIVGRRGHTIVFIEVKQRPTITLAQQAVPEHAWQRIAQAAELWAAAHPALQALDWRFDLIAVPVKGFPKHFRDYWRP